MDVSFRLKSPNHEDASVSELLVPGSKRQSLLNFFVHNKFNLLLLTYSLIFIYSSYVSLLIQFKVQITCTSDLQTQFTLASAWTREQVERYLAKTRPFLINFSNGRVAVVLFKCNLQFLMMFKIMRTLHVGKLKGLRFSGFPSQLVTC